MSLLSNIEDVAFTSAYNVDKVFTEKFSGSFSVPATTFSSFPNIVTETLVNLHGENVLPVMQFSTDNSTWYDAGARSYTEGGTLDPNFSATCYTTSSTLVIIGANFTGSTQTCYYKALLISEE